MKIQKKLLILHVETPRDITNHSLKLANVFLPEPIPFKVNILLYSNASQYSGAIDACKNIISDPP